MFTSGLREVGFSSRIGCHKGVVTECPIPHGSSDQNSGQIKRGSSPDMTGGVARDRYGIADRLADGRCGLRSIRMWKRFSPVRKRSSVVLRWESTSWHSGVISIDRFPDNRPHSLFTPGGTYPRFLFLLLLAR